MSQHLDRMGAKGSAGEEVTNVKVSGRAMALLLPLFTSSCGPLADSRLGQQLKTGSGVAAKQLCSLVFVSELKPERARALYIDPLLRDGAFIVRTELNEDAQAAIARVPGVLRQRAVHREGYGCTLVQDDDRAFGTATRARIPSRPMVLDETHRSEAFDQARLRAAVDRAFQQDLKQPPVNTLAVVVLHEGVLVAERYSADVTSETRLPGWSMTKSVAATLIGLLAHQGRLDIHAPGAIREWRDSADPRSQITLDHLLRMTSGLAIAETADRGDGIDPNSVMLYHEPDAAHFAATRALVHDVGFHFEYMSGNSVLATRAAQDAVGGTLEDSANFIHDNLFAPLGMHSAVFEPDQAGTFLGSSHLLATARDWARFGQLYVDGGVAGGRRLFAEDWVRYVTTPTPASMSEARGAVFWEPDRVAYGAGFWLFGRNGSSGLPSDSFDANGFQGQYLHIIPSRSLVVVRLGATNFRDYDHNRLPRQVIEALRR
jgi:CubicO group peptidase (beta-lactamase class C family)